ncbi:hypothetical protein [Dactylosporangium sp. CA-233914]
MVNTRRIAIAALVALSLSYASSSGNGDPHGESGGGGDPVG